ncbi:heparinase II/III family protein [Verrucomicrobia bacterium]|nr:heparinase II/III family protein [Verrucomicrobiota bacterium]
MRFLLKLKKCQLILSHLGLSWCVGRLVYFCKLKLKFAKWQTPLVTLNDQFFNSITKGNRFETSESYSLYRAENRRKFFFHPNDFEQWKSQLNGWDSASNSPVKAADKVLNGEICYFQCTYKSIGFPPRWAENPFTGEISKISKHWSEISDFEQGDIKVLWEPSRFSFVFLLIRAFARTGDEKYANAFWQAFEDWCIENPTNSGIHWKCGQEITFRIMAWSMGVHAFFDCASTTPHRVQKMAMMMYVSGARIEKNIHYALSQKNNHGVSEAVGLWTIGLLYPEFNKSAHWTRLGSDLITAQVEELIYDDGEFSQHSTNYHRVVLHDLLWALRLGECCECPLPSTVLDKTILAGNWLHHLIVGKNGEAPNFGSNDGAQILQLTSCTYRDYRPVVQAISSLGSEDQSVFPAGKWDEESLWLCGSEILDRKDRQSNQNHTTMKGLKRFDCKESTLFLWAPEHFKHRPAQSDVFHADLWWCGENLLLDTGTYSYNSKYPWSNGLISTKVHNTVTISGMDQCERITRFLLLPWPKVKNVNRWNSKDNSYHYWEGEHDGYHRLSNLVTHRRCLIGLPDDVWVIVDRVYPGKDKTWEINWNFPDVGIKTNKISDSILEFKMSAISGKFSALIISNDPKLKTCFYHGDKESVRGWESCYYRKRKKIQQLNVMPSNSNAYVVSVFGPEMKVYMENKNHIHIESNNALCELVLAAEVTPDSSLLVDLKVKDNIR